MCKKAELRATLLTLSFLAQSAQADAGTFVYRPVDRGYETQASKVPIVFADVANRSDPVNSVSQLFDVCESGSLIEELACRVSLNTEYDAYMSYIDSNVCNSGGALRKAACKATYSQKADNDFAFMQPLEGSLINFWENPVGQTDTAPGGVNFYYTHPDVVQGNWVWHEAYCTSKIYSITYPSQYFCLFEAGLPSSLQNANTFSLRDFSDFLARDSVQLLLDLLEENVPNKVVASEGNVMFSQTETVSSSVLDNPLEAVPNLIKLAYASAFLGTDCDLNINTVSTLTTKVSVFNSSSLGFEQRGNVLTLSGNVKGWAGSEVYGARARLDCDPASFIYSVLWSVSPEVTIEPYAKVIIPIDFTLNKNYSLGTNIFPDQISIVLAESTEATLLSQEQPVVDVGVVTHAEVDLNGLAAIFGSLADPDGKAEELKREVSQKVETDIRQQLANAQADQLKQFEAENPTIYTPLAALYRSDVEGNPAVIAALKRVGGPKTACGEYRIESDPFGAVSQYFSEDLDSETIVRFAAGGDAACLVSTINSLLL